MARFGIACIALLGLLAVLSCGTSKVKMDDTPGTGEVAEVAVGDVADASGAVETLGPMDGAGDMLGPDVCQPDCSSHWSVREMRECGSDGCGGVCGVCPSEAPTCTQGTCSVCPPECDDDTGWEDCDVGLCGVCTPDCDGKECGDDGCEGICGECYYEDECTDDGECVCIPNCGEGLDGLPGCGDDGCGGSCGTCGACEECQGDECITVCWTDPVSGLTWQNPPAESTMKWSAANQYCTDLGLDGGGWHLPTIGELRSLIRGCPATEAGGSCNVEEGDCLAWSCRDISCDGCSYDNGPADGCYWPDEMQGTCLWYWSSSPVVYLDDGAWGVPFDFGVVHYGNVHNDDNVRCVR